MPGCRARGASLFPGSLTAFPPLGDFGGGHSPFGRCPARMPPSPKQPSPRLKLVNLSSVGSASNPKPLTWEGDPGLDFTWHRGATARKEDRCSPLLSGKAPSPFTTSSSRLPQELQNRGGEPGREGWGLRKVFCEASFEYLPLSGGRLFCPEWWPRCQGGRRVQTLA